MKPLTEAALAYLFSVSTWEKNVKTSKKCWRCQFRAGFAKISIDLFLKCDRNDGSTTVFLFCFFFYILQCHRHQKCLWWMEKESKCCLNRHICSENLSVLMLIRWYDNFLRLFELGLLKNIFFFKAKAVRSLNHFIIFHYLGNKESCQVTFFNFKPTKSKFSSEKEEV